MNKLYIHIITIKFVWGFWLSFDLLVWIIFTVIYTYIASTYKLNIVIWFISFIIVSLFPNLEHLDFSDKSCWQCTGWPHISDALQLALRSQSLCFHVWSVEIINFSCCTRHIDFFRTAFIVIGCSSAWPGKLNLNLISATVTSQRIIRNLKGKMLLVLFEDRLFVETPSPDVA